MSDAPWVRNLGWPIAAACLALLTACGGGGSSSVASSPVRNYQATASVGDFLTLQLDPTAHTIAYTNYTNSQSGTVAYTVDPDGAYAITTAHGGLIKAYEIPGFALVASANNTGPQATTTSLVTAINQAPISSSWIEGQQYNYMQWRTSLGGMDVGTVAVGNDGSVATNSYWPFGAMQVALSVGQDATAWNTNTFSLANSMTGADGKYLTLSEPGGNDTVFATQGGFFVVDNPNGSIIGVPQAASSAFDPGTAGTYKALAFAKSATMGTQGNSETGTGAVAGYTMTLSTAGLLTLTDAGGTTLASQTLQPVAADTTLMPARLLANGTGQMPNACPGLFTFEVSNGTLKQDVFLAFINQAILFCSFSYDPTQTGANPTYSYYYGVALKQ